MNTSTLFFLLMQAPLQFRPHQIDEFPGGYQVSVADMNGDGKLDVLALSERPSALVWYENPGWKKHPIAMPGLKQFIDVAPLGGGLAVATDFAMRNSTTGLVHWLASPEAAPVQIDFLPSSHRVRWLDGRSLLVVPLMGNGAKEPDFDVPAPLVLYRRNDKAAWARTVIDETNHVVHGVRIVDWDADKEQEILTASFEGVHVYDQGGGKWKKTHLASGDQRPGPKRGCSEVALGKPRFLATVEPWHGNQVVVYTPGKPMWTRKVIDDSLVDAHALGTGDFDGDGRDEIVAGFRGQGRRLLLYRAKGNAWERVVLDEGDMAAAGLFIADIDGDGDLDIAATGTASGNVKWYENLR